MGDILGLVGKRLGLGLIILLVKRICFYIRSYGTVLSIMGNFLIQIHHRL